MSQPFTLCQAGPCSSVEPSLDAAMIAITTLVQALAGILLPVALVLLLMLCNDRDLVGPLTNPRWLNAVAAAVVTLILGLATGAAFAVSGVALALLRVYTLLMLSLLAVRIGTLITR